jgi:Spy/CpxP family protein refolding chaperone
MTKTRLILGLAGGVLALGLGVGITASAQNTNQGAPPFRGRGMSDPGRRGPMGPGGPMGMLPMLGPELNLTDAQKDQIKNIAASHHDEWQALGERAGVARKALNDAVTADAVDENLIRQRSAEVGAVESDLAVARARTHAEVFNILTADQKAKAKEFRAEAESRMGHRGRGRGR